MRKITTLKLLSNHRLERDSEMKVSVQELYQLWQENKNSSDKVLVEMDNWFCNATSNVILKMIVGKRISSLGNDAESGRWKKALKEFSELSGKFLVAVPYESMENCTVNGCHIPAGTELLINLYKIHRDSRVWSDPYKFKPERFWTTHKNFDVRGQNFELIPFSSGRRMCPGVSFALQVVQLTQANLLHGFDITTPFDEPVDMREAAGLSNFKATPLEVFISPRLPNSCHELK